MITNKKFWHYWRAGQFAEALACTIEKRTERRGAALFQNQELKESTLIGSISAGEFLYDFMMIDPEVVKGIDFARSEDLTNLFTLSHFASTIDTSVLTGDMAQLQGYVAERLIAQELVAAGHDVEFPSTSNQSGWDLLVDGQEFQVKCAATKSVVETHFEKYPDIPVYVNHELGRYYEGNPLVFTSGVSHQQVLEETRTTLHHAEDLLDFEIPWISAGVSAFYNVKRIRKEGITLSTATRNVVADTASRATLSVIGKTALGALGTVVLPGAGSIVFPVIGAYVGMSQGHRISTAIKRMLAKKEELAICRALQQLIGRMQETLIVKHDIKQNKWQCLTQRLPASLTENFLLYHNDNVQLLENVKRELLAIEKTIEDNPLKAFERIIKSLGKAGIHTYLIKDELKAVEDAMVAYMKKI